MRSLLGLLFSKLYRLIFCYNSDLQNPDSSCLPSAAPFQSQQWASYIERNKIAWSKKKSIQFLNHDLETNIQCIISSVFFSLEPESVGNCLGLSLTTLKANEVQWAKVSYYKGLLNPHLVTPSSKHAILFHYAVIKIVGIFKVYISLQA